MENEEEKRRIRRGLCLLIVLRKIRSHSAGQGFVSFQIKRKCVIV